MSQKLFHISSGILEHIQKCTCACVCVGVCSCGCTCVWRLKANLRCHSSGTIHLVFYLSLAWAHWLVWASWLGRSRDLRVSSAMGCMHVHIPHNFIIQSLSLNLEFTTLVNLTGHQAAGILASTSPALCLFGLSCGFCGISLNSHEWMASFYGLNRLASLLCQFLSKVDSCCQI